MAVLASSNWLEHFRAPRKFYLSSDISTFYTLENHILFTCYQISQAKYSNLINFVFRRPTKVLLKSVDLLANDPAPVEVDIASFCVHPDYNASATYNDIGLVRLKDPITEFTDKLHPACLHNITNFPIPQKLIIAGWGLTDNSGKY